MRGIKEIVKQIPVINTLARGVFVLFKKIQFRGSQTYWEAHYSRGGTSGEGSYGKFAEFKAEVLNRFVTENHVRSVIEFGCGDGNQLSYAQYPAYIGLDVSKTAIRQCIHRFRDDTSKSFFWYDPDYIIFSTALVYSWLTWRFRWMLSITSLRMLFLIGICICYSIRLVAL
jgi:hypothetical protein